MASSCNCCPATYKLSHLLSCPQVSFSYTWKLQLWETHSSPTAVSLLFDPCPPLSQTPPHHNFAGEASSLRAELQPQLERSSLADKRGRGEFKRSRMKHKLGGAGQGTDTKLIFFYLDELKCFCMNSWKSTTFIIPGVTLEINTRV